VTEERFFQLIGREVGIDPARALKPVRLPQWAPETGPYPKVQYIVELVGPNLIPGDAARKLVAGAMKSALGGPETYVMAPGEKRWRPLWTGDTAPAYDSLAFAWDLVSERGKLTSQSAKELWSRAERAAKQIQRRAIPMPPHDEVSRFAEQLREIQETLDIGVDITIRPATSSFELEHALVEFYSLGYRFGASELLEWRQPGWPEPLLWVLPLASDSEFSGEGVLGLNVGFSYPCSPSPEEVFDRLIETASIATRCESDAYDADGQLLTDERIAEARANLKQAAAAFASAGIEPGSAEALRLFEP
jgi:hypothetical protein